jgi:hypothetical protein
MGLGMKLEQLQGLSAAATKEASMLKGLEKMKAEWEGLEFRVVAYRDSGELASQGLSLYWVRYWTIGTYRSYPGHGFVLGSGGGAGEDEGRAGGPGVLGGGLQRLR